MEDGAADNSVAERPEPAVKAIIDHGPDSLPVLVECLSSREATRAVVVTFDEGREVSAGVPLEVHMDRNLAIGMLIVTMGTFAPGILLLYPVVEYLWLRKGDQLVPFDRVETYNAVPEKSLIAIQFRGTPWESPAVLRTPEWRVIYDELGAHVGHARIKQE